MPSCYEVLGISSRVTPQDIKTAYHAQLLQHHPDKSSLHRNSDAIKPQADMATSAQGVPSVTDLQLAYDTLRDPERRAAHDVQLQAEEQRKHVHPWDVVALADMDVIDITGSSIHTFTCRCGEDFHLTAAEAAGQKGRVLLDCESCGNVLEVMLAG
jgi:DnaJ-class molecular chaperone